jgi:hypothetical protein
VQLTIQFRMPYNNPLSSLQKPNNDFPGWNDEQSTQNDLKLNPRTPCSPLPSALHCKLTNSTQPLHTTHNYLRRSTLSVTIIANLYEPPQLLKSALNTMQCDSEHHDNHTNSLNSHIPKKPNKYPTHWV